MMSGHTGVRMGCRLRPLAAERLVTRTGLLTRVAQPQTAATLTYASEQTSSLPQWSDHSVLARERDVNC